MKEIEFIIDEDGNVQIDVKNGEGPTCLAETSELEKRLGLVETRKKKNEFYKSVNLRTSGLRQVK